MNLLCLHSWKLFIFSFQIIKPPLFLMPLLLLLPRHQVILFSIKFSLFTTKKALQYNVMKVFFFFFIFIFQIVNTPSFFSEIFHFLEGKNITAESHESHSFFFFQIIKHSSLGAIFTFYREKNIIIERNTMKITISLKKHLTSIGHL